MVQALANGSAGGIFAATAKQFQAKAQAAFQKLQTGAGDAASAAGASTGGIADFIDPETRKKLEAMKQDTDSLVQRLSTGGESAKEAAARKKEEAKQKLKMLKLQAQMAAASGDKKAAARIAKEAAQVAKELGQSVKDRGGGADTTATANGASGSAASATGVDTAAVAADAQATAQQAAPTADGAQTIPAPETPQADNAQADAADPTAQADSAKDEAAADSRGDNQDARQGIQDQRDATIKEGAARKAEMEFQQDTRRVMDELRSIHRQMKALARKDGSAGTAAQMDRAGSDMAEADRMVSDAFGGSTGLTAAPAVTSVDIRV